MRTFISLYWLQLLGLLQVFPSFYLICYLWHIWVPAKAEWYSLPTIMLLFTLFFLIVGIGCYSGFTLTEKMDEVKAAKRIWRQ